MALTRKFLTAMGIEADKIDEIISAHRDTVDGLKEEIDKYKPDAEKLESVQKERDQYKKDSDKLVEIQKDFEQYKADSAKLAEVQAELDTVKKDLADANEAMKNGDKSPYKVKYEALVEEKETLEEEKTKLQKEFDDFKADIDAKAVTAKKSDAYRKLLKKAGVNEKRLDAILKVTSLNDIELEEDGKIKDADKLTDSIKEEWADFIVTKGTQGANPANPPENNGGSSSKGTSLAAQRVAKFNADRYGAVAKED